MGLALIVIFKICTLVPGGFKNLPTMQETQVWSLGQEDPPGEGNGNPLQYSFLENSVDRGVWQATLYGVTKSQTWLSNLHDFQFQSYN